MKEFTRSERLAQPLSQKHWPSLQVCGLQGNWWGRSLLSHSERTGLSIFNSYCGLHKAVCRVSWYKPLAVLFGSLVRENSRPFPFSTLPTSVCRGILWPALRDMVISVLVRVLSLLKCKVQKLNCQPLGTSVPPVSVEWVNLVCVDTLSVHSWTLARVCVRARVHVCAFMCSPVCASQLMEARGWCQGSCSVAFHRTFWDRAFQWARLLDQTNRPAGAAGPGVPLAGTHTWAAVHPADFPRPWLISSNGWSLCCDG